MRVSIWALGVLGAAAWLGTAIGCGGDDETGATGTTTATNGLLCAPSAECTTIQSECMAFADNSAADKATLRFSQLTVTRPAALSQGTVSDVISKGVFLASSACNLAGQGTFTWLLEFEKATGDLKTGSARPSTPDKGYCFVNETLGGTMVAPILDKGVFNDADKTFASANGMDVKVAIFLDTTGSQYVMLPLKKAKLSGKLSDDYNCVGSYNAKELSDRTEADPTLQCKPDATTAAFAAGGKLEGYITLEEADQVVIDTLNATLCVVLANDPMYVDQGKCKRDAGNKIVFQGDWCDTTNSAGGCKDSVVLGADFAASAVTATGDCK